jgi:hypothetical protein
MVRTGKLMNSMNVDPQQLLDGQVGSTKALADFEQSVQASAKKNGRPKGAKNRDVEIADGQLTSCPKCGSTKRTPYFNRRDLPIAGLHLVTGKPYTSIVIRRTSCGDCGQHRDDRHFAYKPAKRRKR